MTDLLHSCTVGWDQVPQAKPEKQKRFWSVMHIRQSSFLVFRFSETRPGGMEPYGHEFIWECGLR